MVVSNASRLMPLEDTPDQTGKLYGGCFYHNRKGFVKTWEMKF